MRNKCSWMNRSNNGDYDDDSSYYYCVFTMCYCSKLFTCIIVFNPCKSPWRQVLLLSSFYRQGNWNIEKLGNIPGTPFPPWLLTSRHTFLIQLFCGVCPMQQQRGCVTLAVPYLLLLPWAFSATVLWEVSGSPFRPSGTCADLRMQESPWGKPGVTGG